MPCGLILFCDRTCEIGISSAPLLIATNNGIRSRHSLKVPAREHRPRPVRHRDYTDAAALLAAFWKEVKIGHGGEKNLDMNTMKVGIASYEDMKARTMAIVRGELRL